MTATERGDWLDHAATCETCRAIANTLPTEGPAIPPATIGRFVPTREIGRGAMGVVYAADDPELGRPVALKLLHDASDGERLHREARALAKLAHENVVRVYEIGVDAGRVWVAMELVEGVTLRSWLATPHAQREVLALLLRAGHGLAAAHAAGIVHRDFKPDNVFVGGDRVVVGDFGLSRLGVHPGGGDHALAVEANDTLTRTGAAVGTPAYMAPEQITGEATSRSDQFAFCVTAWEALFGVRPFHGATLRELREASLRGYFTRPSRAIPRRVERALRRGLAGVPADRFPSMAELLDALAPPRRTRWVAAAALAAAATTGGIVYALVDRAADPCEVAGEAIFDVWTDAQHRRVAEQDPAMEKLIDDYAKSWQAARTDACRRPRSTSQRAARDICLERARVELANQLASPTLDDLPTKLPPIASCEGELALPKTPGYEVDARGCGCPYSACTDDRVCLSQCNARAFRPSGPVPGIAVAGEQEAIVGASGDGTTLLYLAGKDCRLDHLYLARRDGERYTPIDLTPELAKHGLEPFEGCCTLAPDARSLIVSHRRRVGLVRLSLVDNTLVAPDDHEFVDVQPDATATQRIWSPVISADQRSLYFVLVETKPVTVSNGPHEAHRDSIARPFAAATRMTGRPNLYESISGISADGLTLFMATEFMTSVLLRDTTTSPFGDLGIGNPPARLPGWRAIPIENCRRIVTTMSPGGCRQEEMVFLEAIGP